MAARIEKVSLSVKLDSSSNSGVPQKKKSWTFYAIVHYDSGNIREYIDEKIPKKIFQIDEEVHAPASGLDLKNWDYEEIKHPDSLERIYSKKHKTLRYRDYERHLRGEI